VHICGDFHTVRPFGCKDMTKYKRGCFFYETPCREMCRHTHARHPVHQSSTFDLNVNACLGGSAILVLQLILVLVFILLGDFYFY